MKSTRSLKMAIVGFVAAGTLALGANAQALDIDAGVFTVGNGDAANPIVINVADPGDPGLPVSPYFFTDTINFDLGAFTHFNMTSTSADMLNFFGASIFRNLGDTQVVPTSLTHTEVLLPDLGLLRDYHLHPAGLELPTGGNYQITMWGSNAAPVPVPAAVYLFGSGLIGLVGLARRKMSA